MTYITNLTRSDNALAVPAAHHFHRAEARCDVLAYIDGTARAGTTVVHSHSEGAPRVIVGDLGEIGAFAAYTVLSETHSPGSVTTYTDPRSVFPAPIGAVLRVSILGKPLTDTVTGYAVKTFGFTDHWTDVPCYVLAKFGAWPVRDCEVIR